MAYAVLPHAVNILFTRTCTKVVSTWLYCADYRTPSAYLSLYDPIAMYRSIIRTAPRPLHVYSMSPACLNKSIRRVPSEPRLQSVFHRSPRCGASTIRRRSCLRPRTACSRAVCRPSGAVPNSPFAPYHACIVCSRSGESRVIEVA